MVQEQQVFGSPKAQEKGIFLLRKFFAACDLAYRRSKKGTLPQWVTSTIESSEKSSEINTTAPTTEPFDLFWFPFGSQITICGWKFQGGDPSLNHRGWLALLRLHPLQEFWRLELRENHRVQLLKMLAPTWVIDPTPIPPQAVIPGLNIQNWIHTPRNLPDGRGICLQIEGKEIWGPDSDQARWVEAIEQACLNFSNGKTGILQALPQRPDRATITNLS